jgi:hypothetical protein
MSKKKTYVSPQVTRVKLEPTQAVLSQCSIGVTNVKNSAGPSGFCNGADHPFCKQQATPGSSPSAATS